MAAALLPNITPAHIPLNLSLPLNLSIPLNLSLPLDFPLPLALSSLRNPLSPSSSPRDWVAEGAALGLLVAILKVLAGAGLGQIQVIQGGHN